MVRILLPVTAGEREIMFGIKFIISAALLWINSGKPHWSVQELWFDQILPDESHPKQNPCADSTLSVTAIPAMCGGQMRVLGAVMGLFEMHVC